MRSRETRTRIGKEDEEKEDKKDLNMNLIKMYSK